MAPWGDLIVCEDTSNHCGLVGIRPDGSQYQLADNAHSNSELAGVCFAPDGKTLFVNIQYPGMTLAVTGPFPTLIEFRSRSGHRHADVATREAVEWDLRFAGNKAQRSEPFRQNE